MDAQCSQRESGLLDGTKSKHRGPTTRKTYIMKLTRFTNLLLIGLALTLASGCRKGPGMTTHIPGQGLSGKDPGAGTGEPLAPGQGTNPSDVSGGIQSNPAGSHDGWAEDGSIFKANTVHFAFDSSVVKPSEKDNITAVASHLKSNASAAVRVEGHCDERGTAEYNRALGERRAQAIRTDLVGMGIEASRVDTITYGFERPVDSGHDESAWGKNRRGEFILLTPPGK